MPPINRVRWSLACRDEVAVISQSNPSVQLLSVKDAVDSAETDAEALNAPKLSLVDIAPLPTDQGHVTCAEWRPEPTAANVYAPSKANHGLIAAGFNSGRIVVSKFGADAKTTAEMAPQSMRPCLAMSWNTRETNLLAAGYEKHKNDFSVLVWDLNATGRSVKMPITGQQESSIPEVSLNMSYRHPLTTFGQRDAFAAYQPTESAISLAWGAQQFSNLLFVGAHSKIVRMFDIRVRPSEQGNATRQFLHGKPVTSIRVDPFNPTRFLSCSDDGLVRIWDLQNSAECLLSFSSPNVVQIDYSPVQPNLLASVGREEGFAKMWDLCGISAHDFAPLARNFPIKNPADSFSWSPHHLSPPHFVTISKVGILQLHALRCSRPVAIAASNSCCLIDGDLVYPDISIGQIQAPSVPKTPNGRSLSVLSLSTIALITDIADIMRSRAIAGYELNCERNAEIVAPVDVALQDTWSWIASAIDSRPADEKEQSKANVFADGVMRLLGMDNGETSTPTPPPPPSSSSGKSGGESTSEVYPPKHLYQGTNLSMRISIMESESREKAIKACGWMGLAASEEEELGRHVDSLVEQGYVERAALISLFHLDLRRAVAILSNASARRADAGGAAQPAQGAFGPLHVGATGVRTVSRQQSGGGNDGHTPPPLAGTPKQSAGRSFLHGSLIEYAPAPPSELSMASLCLSMLADTPSEQKNPNVLKSCEQVRKQLSDKRLQCMLSFLGGRDNASWYTDVLECEGLPYTDRVAFALRFIPEKPLRAYVQKLLYSGIKVGDLRLLLLTGLNAGCINLLQSFVDHSSDIQTAALISSVVLAMQSWRIGSSALPGSADAKALAPFVRLVDTYRDLLNHWQMWKHRATFDVSRSALLGPDKDPLQSKSMAGARCQCGQPLAATNQKHASKGSRLRAIPSAALTATRNSNCVHCSKPLPKCAVCLVGLTIAPTATGAARNRPQQPPSSSTPAAAVDDLSALERPSIRSALVGKGASDFATSRNFQEWFSWCQTCRHGGHAGHMAEWFKTHFECPVSNCNCQCKMLDDASVPSLWAPRPVKY